MKLYGEFPYNSIEKKIFASGELRDEWFKKYPMLFDDDDYKIATNQPGYHFFEWLGAIKIYEDMGWISLVEKYQFKNHPRQREIFKSLVSDEIFQIITTSRISNNQGPDLFVFSPQKNDWFFCEVKGGKDRVSKSQEEMFKKIKEVSQKPVYLLKFKLDSE